MAIWQYQFLLIPGESVSNEGFYVPQDSEGLLEDDFFWNQVPTPCSIFNEIEKSIRRGQSWNKKIKLFGREDSNCIEVYCVDGLVESVSFRVDFGNSYEDLLREVIEFVRLKNLVLIDENLEILAPNFVSIDFIIKNSHQYKTYHKLKG